MIVYNKLGYTINLIEKDDAKELFKFLVQYKLKDVKEPEERLAKRDGLKKKIIKELETNTHTPLALYKDSKLIGICFTELYERNDKVGKISYIKINEKYNKTIAPHVLFNFLTNVLYKEIRVIYHNGIMNKFADISRVYPKVMNISSFKDEYISRLNKYFEDK